METQQRQHWLPATLLAALLFLAPPALADQDTWVGPARVVDGDTLYIDKIKFRLYGIDAPEKAQTCVNPKGQDYACGLVSKEALAQKIGSQNVSCTRRSKDMYGREVAVCSLLGFTGPEDVNKWLVENGMAVAYREYGKDYIPAEEAAKAARRGIWAGSFEYPATWRKEEKAHIQHPPLTPIMPYQPPSPPASKAPVQVASAAATGAKSAGAVTPEPCGPGVPPIKGNINAKGVKIYHVPGGPSYDSVLIELDKGEAYFCKVEDAVNAGFRGVK